ncbi:hypothetical protein EV424DRAFT_1550738 [Suillus variegatus]|nr:hypothetical protein EV424DRAFT_1550738 [Suillus variegatus]
MLSLLPYVISPWRFSLGKGTNSNLSHHVAASNYVPQAPTISFAAGSDMAREFGASPLFDKILPLLMEHTLEDQERHLLVKNHPQCWIDDAGCACIRCLGTVMHDVSHPALHLPSVSRTDLSHPPTVSTLMLPRCLVPSHCLVPPIVSYPPAVSYPQTQKIHLLAFVVASYFLLLDPLLAMLGPAQPP